MLGATFKRLGTIPLYNPLRPSWAEIVRTASNMDLYWYPIPDIVFIWNRLRRTSLQQRVSVRLIVKCERETLTRDT